MNIEKMLKEKQLKLTTLLPFGDFSMYITYNGMGEPSAPIVIEGDDGDKRFSAEMSLETLVEFHKDLTTFLQTLNQDYEKKN